MTTPSSRSTWGFMLRHPAHLIALGFGSGLSPAAPGTVGTLWAWVTFLLLQPWMSGSAWALLLIVSLLASWWACTVTAQHLQVADPSSIVCDEIVAFWLILYLVMPTSVWGQLGAFVLFRCFDVVKPGPIGWVDQKLKGLGARGGFGILFDDLLAALCTLLVIALWRTL